MRVLILEDDALLALDLAEMVSEHGHDILGPCHGLEDAISMFHRDGPDFAVLDYDLGGQTSEALADLLTRNATPFVFLTGHGRQHLPERFAGQTVLQKPISPSQLQPLIDSR